VNNTLELQKVSEETMRFMRGKYRLDEVPGKYYDIDCLKFRQGKKTILSINLHDDRYDFQVIFGKAEREKFEERRDEFPLCIHDIYDNSKTQYDGMWMLIPVADLDTLEAVKKLILIKKNPNRKPFPKEQALYSDCGHRCDLCVHYSGGTISDEFRLDLIERINRVYSPEKPLEDAVKNHPLCPGCEKAHSGDFNSDVKQNLHANGLCEQKKCAAIKGNDKCSNCSNYPCPKATAGWPPRIELKHILADDVTWAILPYVDGQYGN
jgi:hypothetical protein